MPQSKPSMSIFVFVNYKYPMFLIGEPLGDEEEESEPCHVEACSEGGPMLS